MVDLGMVIMRCIPCRIAFREGPLDMAPRMTGGRPRSGSVQILYGRHRAPAIENPPIRRKRENARLKEALRMFHGPIGAALEKVEVASVRIQRQPSSRTADRRDLLVRIAYAVEVQLPIAMRLIGETLWLAADGVDFTTCSPDSLNNTLCHVAP